MRDLDDIDSELRLMVAVRRTTQQIYGSASAMTRLIACSANVGNRTRRRRRR
jgi:hypothetical protein